MEKFIWGNIGGIAYLWILALGFLFYYFGFHQRERISTLLLDAGLTREMIKGDYKDRRKLKAFLILCSLFFSVLALMQPMYDFTWDTVRRMGTDIIVALDTSKSMYATDITPSRFERSKLEIKNMVNELDGDRIGLVIFTGNALTQCPLTLDYATFKLFLDEVEIGTLARGGTSLASAIETAAKSFDLKYKEERILILVTDGETHDDRLEAALEAAKKAGIKIFAVGIGTREGVPILLPAPNGEKQYVKDDKGNIVLTKLNDEPLKKMALETGGAYIHADNTDFSLEKLYEMKIAPLKGRELESKRKKRYENRFYIPLALALLCLLIEAFLPEKARKR